MGTLRILNFIALLIISSASQDIAVRSVRGAQITQNIGSPASAFKAIPNKAPANLFKNYVAKGSQFVLPPIPDVLLASILLVYLYTWLKK